MLNYLLNHLHQKHLLYVVLTILAVPELYEIIPVPDEKSWPVPPYCEETGVAFKIPLVTVPT